MCSNVTVDMPVKKMRWIILIVTLALGMGVLVGCKQSESAVVVETVLVTQEVIVEGETIIQEEVTVTPAPAALPSTQEPSPTQPLPSPVPTQPLPSPTAVIEQRTVEVEWPPQMRLGDSDFVRLSLIPSAEGYIITTEIQEHTTLTQTIQVQRQAGYELNAAARLDGVGFIISPDTEQQYSLPPGETITWRWSVAPQTPGDHYVTITLMLRWVPLPGSGHPPIETVAYSRGLNIQVTSFFGLNRRQAMTGGLLGLFLGGSMGMLALVSPAQPRASRLRTPTPNASLVLEPRPELKISPPEAGLLRALFNRYSRLVLENEFLSGYSGARTFLAQPIHPDGRADAHTIIKIGQRHAIQKEFENYETFVKDTLPPITARIQHVPVSLRGSDRAALQYTFIAEPGRVPTSLRLALLENPNPALLIKLFETFGPNWWMQRSPHTFRLGREYDGMLPAHYVIEPAAGRAAVLDGRSAPAATRLAPGDMVMLRNFSHREQRPDGRSLSLRGSASPGQPPLRVRWMGLGEPEGATGRVAATRQTLLEGFVTGLDLFNLPDPLPRLPALLDEAISGTRSTIHGDLNLENILVGAGDFVWLIDFATTRDGHPLFDFAHLEAEVIAHIIASQMLDIRHYLAALDGTPPDYLSRQIGLRDTLHSIAARCLFNPSQPREYHLALSVACLGALKFTNLSSTQKHLLYLTAAHIVKSL